MKTGTRKRLYLLALAALCILFYAKKRGQVMETSLRDSEPRTSPPRTHKLTGEPEHTRMAFLNTPFENPIQAAMLWSNAFPEQAVRFAAALDSKNVPIHFYGLCLDQDGIPLEDVQLKMSVRQWHGVSTLDLRAVDVPFQRRSDTDGKFELSGVRGDIAGVAEASKDGYQWVKKGSGYLDFWAHRTFVPTANEPYVMYFWKIRGAEALYMTKPMNRFAVRCNGEPTLCDLLAAKRAESGTSNPVLRVTMQRNPESLRPQNQTRFDWQYTLEIPGGGIQSTTTNMPFMAPADGYLSNVTFGYKAHDPDWKRELEAVLFIKTSNGNFGRMEVTLLGTGEGNVASFGWSLYLNPSGSPVLEYDPAKRLKAPLSKPSPASMGAAQQPAQPAAAVPQPSAQKVAPPFVPQPPPGFQTLTNRGKAITSPVPPRPE